MNGRRTVGGLTLYERTAMHSWSTAKKSTCVYIRYTAASFRNKHEKVKRFCECVCFWTERSKKQTIFKLLLVEPIGNHHTQVSGLISRSFVRGLYAENLTTHTAFSLSLYLSSSLTDGKIRKIRNTPVRIKFYTIIFHFGYFIYMRLVRTKSVSICVP